MNWTDYCKEHDPIVLTHESGAILVIHQPGKSFDGWALHHLDDKIVTSSASGPGYWLVDRQNGEQKNVKHD